MAEDSLSLSFTTLELAILTNAVDNYKSRVDRDGSAAVYDLCRRLDAAQQLLRLLNEAKPNLEGWTPNAR